MRKIILFLLCLCLLIPTLIACRDEETADYPPVERTAEEARVVMKVGGYDVYYDQYRMLYLQFKNVYGNDDAKIKAAVEAELRSFYALFTLAEKKGVSVFGETMNNAVVSGIKLLIEGDAFSSGYGSYENYLKTIRENGMTDATVRLQLRADAVRADLLQKYIDSGELSVDTEALTAFLQSDHCVRVQYIYVDRSAFYYNGQFDEEAYEAVVDAAEAKLDVVTDDNFIWQMTQYAPTMNSAVDTYISLYQFDAPYTEIGNAAFALSLGGTDILAYENLGRIYFIRRATPEALSEQNRDAVIDACRTHLLGEKIKNEAGILSVTTTEVYNSINLDSVKAP